MRPDHKQFAERWLDQALEHYSGAEPRPGFESRVLANLAAAKAERRSAWRRRFVIAGACAALVPVTIGLALLLRPIDPPKEPVSAVSPATSTASNVDSGPPKIADLTRGAPSSPRVSGRRTTKPPGQRSSDAGKEPRQPQFPAAMPLSGQQMLVVAYISSTPAEELMRVSAEQREWQQRVESGAKASQAEDAPAQTEINHLRFPLLESGSRQSGEAR